MAYFSMLKCASFCLLLAFLLNCIGPLPQAGAGEFTLPEPGVRVDLSPAFNPPILKGIKVHPDNPFKFGHWYRIRMVIW